MEPQFSRTAFMLGRKRIEKLNSVKVAVFGVGGVGGHAIEALVRAGVGAVDVFDNDVVNETNINRQLVALHSTIGRHKVDVMKGRASDINPKVKFGAFAVFYSAENAGEIDLRQYDYVIDAIDTVSSKIELIVRANSAGTRIISSMGAANKLDPTVFEVTDIYKTSVCPLARVMRKELKARGIEELKVVFSREEVIAQDSAELERFLVSSAGEGKRQIPASNPFVPPVAGLILAGEVIKDLVL